MVALLLFGGAYAVWPPDFSGALLFAPPFGMLLRAVTSSLLAIIGMEFLISLAIVALTEN